MSSIATQTAGSSRRGPKVTLQTKRPAETSSGALGARQSVLSKSSSLLHCSSSSSKLHEQRSVHADFPRVTPVPLTSDDVKLLHSTPPQQLKQLSMDQIEVLYQSAVKYTNQQALLAEEQRLKKIGIKPSRILAEKLARVHKDMERVASENSASGSSVREILAGRLRSPSPNTSSVRPMITLADIEREEQLQRDAIALYAARVLRQLK